MFQKLMAAPGLWLPRGVCLGVILLQCRSGIPGRPFSLPRWQGQGMLSHCKEVVLEISCLVWSCKWGAVTCGYARGPVLLAWVCPDWAGKGSVRCQREAWIRGAEQGSWLEKVWGMLEAWWHVSNWWARLLVVLCCHVAESWSCAGEGSGCLAGYSAVVAVGCVPASL